MRKIFVRVLDMQASTLSSGARLERQAELSLYGVLQGRAGQLNCSEFPEWSCRCKIAKAVLTLIIEGTCVC